MKKVMFISSAGGHLTELLQLKPLFKKYDTCLVTEKNEISLNKKNEFKKIGFLIPGTMSKPVIYIIKLGLNCFVSLYYFIKFNPKVIVTTGAHNAGPMCCIGKILGRKVIYIETFANLNKKSRTGRIIYKFADLFIVQWEPMLKLYPKAKFVGGIF